MGLDDNLAYADALTLLERGADPNRAAADGMTFVKMLTEHWQHFRAGKVTPPPEFAALWEWAQTHGLLSPAGVTPLHRCYCGRTFGFTAGCFLPGDSEGGRVTCIEMPRGSGE